MASLGLTIIITLWLVSALADYTEFCYLWQIKEYRLDRLRDFFGTPAGKKYWLKYNLSIRPLIALTAFFWPINAASMVKIILLVIFSIDAVRALALIYHRAWRRPKFTLKSVSIILTSISFDGLIITYAGDWAMIFLVIVCRFFILSGVVLFFQLLTSIIKRWYIHFASQKLARYPKLKIIGITGSYGKTSVKNFLTNILKVRYRVMATPKSINTEIGVAKFILSTAFANLDVFIVEMGAYRIGEIKIIAELVKPQIGILTAINEQHLSLFGDLKNTQQAKYELLRSLPRNGLAVTNADNPYCMEYVSELKSPVATFGADPDRKPNLHLFAASQTNIGIECGVRSSDGSSANYLAPVHGIHNCLNLAPCLIVAKYLGITEAEIKSQLQTFTGLAHGLKTYRYGQSLIIDDTFNSNPDGFKSALNFLATFPSKLRRVVVTRGMYELGEKSDELHERMGEEIAFCAEELVLINHDFESPLRRGIGDKYHTTIAVKDTPESLLEYLKTLRETKCVILLENRIPELVRRQLPLGL